MSRLPGDICLQNHMILLEFLHFFEILDVAIL